MMDRLQFSQVLSAAMLGSRVFATGKRTLHIGHYRSHLDSPWPDCGAASSHQPVRRCVSQEQTGRRTYAKNDSQHRRGLRSVAHHENIVGMERGAVAHQGAYHL